MNTFSKNLTLWLVISLMMILLFQIFKKETKQTGQLSYSQFLNMVEQGEVSQVTIQGDKISGTSNQGRFFRTFAPKDLELIKILRNKKIEITAKPGEASPWYMTILVSWFPMLLLIGVWIFFMRQMQAGGGKALSFGKSRARLATNEKNKVTFDDVAGIEEAKEELQEIIEFLRDPKKFTRLGGRIPKGVLLIGAPGTGKTLLARAIAGEAGVPFLSISGSDFVEMFVGVGASRVRDLFVQGKKNAPCIIFLDEIDAVGRHRGAGLGGGHDEREQTLNQLLVEMDGFESNEGVILISATNRPDVLDPALLRPGRFDRQVVVPVPDVRGRESILKVHTTKTRIGDDVDHSVIARGTPGFTGADLENMVNEAALLAARRNKDKIDMQDMEDAKDKVLMGAERKSMIISDDEKKTTAYHEAGHTLTAKLLPDTDPIHKVTIIPRGMALGLTQQLPLDDKHTYTKEYLLNNICILMGGRIAEEIALNTQTTGASNDIERATEIARKMICEYGMNEKLGPLSFGKKEEEIFLGREISQHRDYSEETAQKIDEEVNNLIDNSYKKTHKLISDNRNTLNNLAKALLEKETLNGSEIDEIVGKRKEKDTQQNQRKEKIVIQKGKKAKFLKWLDYNLDLDSKTFIMGILNITPDSFFDGGTNFRENDAVKHGLRMAAEGADIIDIGGESTRPFSNPLSLDEELRRVIPVIKALAQEINIPISIDTYKSEVASQAIEAGATMVNDISALKFDPAMGQLVADAGVPIVLMHMKGTPKNMQTNPTYKDLFGEIIVFLGKAIEQAISSGIKKDFIIIDPGIGFGKSFDDNLKIINNLHKFSSLGQPLLVGTSNKAFIGHVLDLSVKSRETGTMATIAASALNGANIVRVHNVKAAKETVTMIDAIMKAEI